MRSRIIFEWRKLPRDRQLRCWAKRATSPLGELEPEVEAPEVEEPEVDVEEEEEEAEEVVVMVVVVDLDSVMLLRMDGELLTRKVV